MFQESYNYQAAFQGQVWNAFNGLGLDYTVLLYCDYLTDVRFLPPKGTKLADYHEPVKAMQFLIDNNLAKITKDNLPKSIREIKARYVLTEKGQKLFNKLSILENFHDAFIEKIKPILF